MDPRLASAISDAADEEKPAGGSVVETAKQVSSMDERWNALLYVKAGQPCLCMSLC